MNLTQLPQFMLHHWDLWLALCIILVLLLIHELKTYKPLSLSPQEAVLFINRERAQVIDLRDEPAFKQGHILDAIHAKAEAFDDPALSKYKDTPLLFICKNESVTIPILKKWEMAGFKTIRVLTGGIDAWQTTGFPLTK